MNMTDEEMFCNGRCSANPCRHRCEYVSCYLAGIKKGKQTGCKKILEKIAEKQFAPYATCEPIELTFEEVRQIVTEIETEEEVK